MRQEIQQLLESDEVIEVLNYNSLQQLQQLQNDDDTYHVTWKCLLNCYHRSLILVSRMCSITINNYLYLFYIITTNKTLFTRMLKKKT